MLEGMGVWRTSLFREKKRERTLKPAAVLSASSSSLIQIFLNSLRYNSEISYPKKRGEKKKRPWRQPIKVAISGGSLRSAAERMLHEEEVEEEDDTAAIEIGRNNTFT